jgi:hypothetical protein
VNAARLYTHSGPSGKAQACDAVTVHQVCTAKRRLIELFAYHSQLDKLIADGLHVEECDDDRAKQRIRTLGTSNNNVSGENLCGAFCNQLP